MRGIVLIITLWVILILAALASTVAYTVRVEMSVASYRKLDLQARLLARAAIERVIAQLREDRNGYDYYGEPWRREYLDDEKVSQGMLCPKDIEFVDENGNLLGYYRVTIGESASKFNINIAMPDEELKTDILSTLLKECGAEDPEVVADCIMDWLDPNDLHRLNGVESDYYERLSPPYEAKNGPIDTIDELLLVKGFSRELLYGNEEHPGFAQFITLYSDDGRGSINVNVAYPEVLKAIFGESTAEDILTQRRGADGIDGTEDDDPFKSIADFMRAFPEVAGGLFRSIGISVHSSHFEVEAVGLSADKKIQHKIFAVIDRDYEPVRIVYWRED